MARNASAEIAAGNGESTTRFEGLIEAGFSRGSGAASLGEEESSFVANFFFTSGEAEFKIGLRKTGEADSRVMEGRTIYIKIVVLVGGADTIRILTVDADVAREKRALSVADKLVVGGKGGEGTLDVMFWRRGCGDGGGIVGVR